MKASDLLVRALEHEGVQYIFGLPGEENLDLLEWARALALWLKRVREYKNSVDEVIGLAYIYTLWYTVSTSLIPHPLGSSFSCPCALGNDDELKSGEEKKERNLCKACFRSETFKF